MQSGQTTVRVSGVGRRGRRWSRTGGAGWGGHEECRCRGDITGKSRMRGPLAASDTSGFVCKTI